MNQKLNFLKCFACFGVVFIHITFPGIFGQIISKACAFAVPVFFMIAGYYAFGSNAKTIKRRLLKILKILLFAYLVFFAYSIANTLIRDGAEISFSTYFGWSAIVKAVCFCTIDFAVPLWYLIAMAEAYITWYFVVRNGKEQALLKLIPFLFILQVLLISYCDTMQLAWFWKTNFITRALPWFLLGYYIHSNRLKNIKEISSYKLIILSVIGCIITLIPAVFNLHLDFSSIGYIPYAFGLFALSLKKPEESICKPLEYIGSKLSLNIYILHIPIGSVVGFCAAYLGINVTSNVWIWFRPIVVLLCAVLVSWSILVVQKLIKNKNKDIAP